MTLAEAAAWVGNAVVYQPYPGAPYEQGVVTSVNEHYAFVRYGADVGSRATRADHLRPLRPDLQ